jgi:hypothetical protein
VLLNLGRASVNNLTLQQAFIFRIVHRDNVPWILDHGLHCSASRTRDPHYVSIGNPDLIAKRSTRAVPMAPGGMLSDYVPFYFTPHSPMLYNIKTGYNGITRRGNEEIVILASSLHRLAELNVRFLFSDRHAYLNAARFSSDLDDLSWIDWGILQRRDFRRDENDPEKVERYQAEGLVHKRCPIEAMVGIGCYEAAVQKRMAAEVAKRGLTIPVVAKPGWYF